MIAILLNVPLCGAPSDVVTLTSKVHERSILLGYPAPAGTKQQLVLVNKRIRSCTVVFDVRVPTVRLQTQTPAVQQPIPTVATSPVVREVLHAIQAHIDVDAVPNNARLSALPYALEAPTIGE